MELTHPEKRPYPVKFRQATVEKALSQGIRRTAKALNISRNTLRKWIREGAIKKKYYRSLRRFSIKVEELVVSLKEKQPTITIAEIQKQVTQKSGRSLSFGGIQGILARYGMSGRNYLPLMAENTPEIQRGMESAESFKRDGNVEKAAQVLNALPALSDFSILKKIPPGFLSLRRQAEQLEALRGATPPAEMLKKAQALRRLCEREKFFFTAIFVVTLEMNALNLTGDPNQVFLLYQKYHRCLPGLPPPLRYLFLMECFLSYVSVPGKYPIAIFKNFLCNLERFVSKLPEGKHRVVWYEAIGSYYHLTGEINKSLEWMKNLLRELPQEYKKKYLHIYLLTLAIKGAYSEIFKFDESFKDASAPIFLMYCQARSLALLGTGKPEEALQLSLNAFYEAEKENLRPAMGGFTFLVACCYGAMKKTENMKLYLKMSISFSKGIGKLEKLFFPLLKPAYSTPGYSPDLRFHLVRRYLYACKTMRKKDYFDAYRFAERKGLLGFFHRIILLHPEAVTNLIARGKETYLPGVFLDLPVFKEEQRVFRLFLLKERESVFYGDRKIIFSPRMKDFHLLVYLFLNRKKNLDRDSLASIFYKDVANPTQCLIKALCRIRKQLGLPKGVLALRKGRVFFDANARIDLEEFEERYKLGRISVRVEEIRHALEEYRSCFDLYKRSPFEGMGYYYNFAEERRTNVRQMYETLSDALIKDAEERGKTEDLRKFREKLKKECLPVHSADAHG